MTDLFKVFKRNSMLVAVTMAFGIVGLNVSRAEAAPKVCESLPEQDFTGVVDAPTQVTAAQVISRTPNATGSVPSHCRIEGYVSPNVGFVLWLPPESKWNGNFIEMSLGGYGGSTKSRAPWCEEALRRGYACLTHNTGHTGTPTRASWAYNNLQAEFDYGIRGFYVAALAGKALVQHFYNTPPSYSYHVGSSGGGKQGLVAAQRYPWTFDGILALEPSNVTATGVMALWNALAMHDDDGTPLYEDVDLDVLHEGAIVACDADDGLEDGIIGGDPRTCKFDPGVLLCDEGKKARCLSRQQVEAARKIYAGPVTSDGEKLSQYFPWYPALPGSEKGRYFAMDLEYKTTWWRYLGFYPDPGPTWEWSDFDFDHDYKRSGVMDAIVNGYSNPDLRNFKTAGGKLIIIQGWEDSGLPAPRVTTDYYTMVEKILGGRVATQEAVRLFMVPGRSHFDEDRYGGDGGAAGDWLSYLEAWVERDEAPDMVVGYHADDWSKDEGELYRGLKNPERYSFSRPHFPYPLQAKYQGSGDPDDYRSFEAIEPEE